MKPTKQLIRALRETAHKLRNGADYNWYRSARCNCGLLAQSIMGVDEAELVKLSEYMGGSWSDEAARKFKQCDATGLPVDFVFATLAQAGMDANDFYRVEFAEWQKWGTLYKDRDSVAAWMDREADELERRRIDERFVEPLT